jgi:N-acetyl-anhydromuramyl-L-alanine amidase AmpD
MPLKTPTSLNLARDAQGPDVEALQAYLKKFGYLIMEGQIDPFSRQPLAGVIATSEKGTFGSGVESA